MRALEDAGIPWELAVESDSDRTIEATVSADLAINTMLEGTEPPYAERIQHGGALPDLPGKQINMYMLDGGQSEVAAHLAQLLRSAYRFSKPGVALAAAE
jgi:hypothetical protein